MKYVGIVLVILFNIMSVSKLFKRSKSDHKNFPVAKDNFSNMFMMIILLLAQFAGIFIYRIHPGFGIGVCLIFSLIPGLLFTRVLINDDCFIVKGFDEEKIIHWHEVIEIIVKKKKNTVFKFITIDGVTDVELYALPVNSIIHSIKQIEKLENVEVKRKYI